MKLKGAAWIYGILTLMIISVIFFFGTNIRYQGTTAIVLGSVEVYSTQYSAEVIKNAIEGAFFYAADNAPEVLAPQGGGFSIWKKESPTNDALVEKLIRYLEAEIDKAEIDSHEGKSIEWGNSKVEVVATDETFIASLRKPFEISSRLGNPEVALQYNATVERIVNSLYYYMIQVGLDVAQTCPNPTEGTEIFLNNRISKTVSKIPDTIMYTVSILDNLTGLNLIFTLDCSTLSGIT